MALILIAPVAVAQDQDTDQSAVETGPVQTLLQTHGAAIAKASRKTIQPTIDALLSSGLPEIQQVLQKWQAREIWQRKSDSLFFAGEEIAKRTIRLTDFDTGETVGELTTKELKQIKPNSGVQALIGTALVQFQLSDPDPDLRAAALLSIERDPGPDLLAPLRASIATETDPALRALDHPVAGGLHLHVGPAEDLAVEGLHGVSILTGDLEPSDGGRHWNSPCWSWTVLVCVLGDEGNVGSRS